MLMARIRSQWFLISVAWAGIFAVYLLHPHLFLNPCHHYHMQKQNNKAILSAIQSDNASNNSFMIPEPVMVIVPKPVIAIVSEDPYATHLRAVREGCGEICELTMPPPTVKRFDCMALGENAAIDAAGWEFPPPRQIPEAMRAAFTFDGRIVPSDYYLNQKYLGSTANEATWTRERVDYMIEQARLHTLDGNYGREETNWVIEGLARMNLSWAEEVLVIGSENPWVEACVLAAGALRVTTLEYGIIASLHPQITTLTPDELRSQFAYYMNRFDAVVTFSSVEHSGLGRYGDALNPYGDKQALARAWCLAKPGALLLLGVMCGATDGLEFNAHRVYGPMQLAHLTANWMPVWRAPGGGQVVHIYEKRLFS
jgi:hypothetical protein